MKDNDKNQSPKPEYSYTFKVFCSFEMQYTFSEEEVEGNLDVRLEDADPTDMALEALEKELEKHLSQLYQVVNVDASADYASLIDVEYASPVAISESEPTEQ